MKAMTAAQAKTALAKELQAHPDCCDCAKQLTDAGISECCVCSFLKSYGHCPDELAKVVDAIQACEKLPPFPEC